MIPSEFLKYNVTWNLIYSILLLILFILLSLEYLRKKKIPIKIPIKERVKVKWSVWIYIYIIIFAIICLFGYIWCVSILSGAEGLSKTADQARIFYETRTILGYGEAIVIASVAFFIPLLIFIWNNVLDSIFTYYEKMINLMKDLPKEQANKKGMILNEVEEIKASIFTLKDLGKDLRIPFYISIVLTVFLIICLCYANFFTVINIKAYVFVIILKVAAILLFLWYLTLLIIFLTSVQTEKRKYSYLEFLFKILKSD